ncbi:uncharacterized protein LOC100167121 isoform X2 [Acyrthosiphon pisum]|uniref:C2H2-type domain-containing protein n=1 Tax=Acyrthosiphon pisum TaxID=7029 RepID=A0A8R2D482_ACYPI|nr:uncharacterized protein LOC100167121 isoform X2 [Acyrthosiphon pisum]|eukprot:XP_016658833.1 PREDICTED: uncharacterized protein LOC100167121 isoform X2 [Acyrthosiphon pisum]
MTLEILAQEKVWLNKSYYADAERVYFEKQTKILKNETFGKNKNDQVKSRNNTNCEDCSMCNILTQIDLHNDIGKLLDKVEQWDKIDSTMNLNQYKQINKFECLVCSFKTFKFSDWKCHIMSLPHMAACHKIKNLYSYVCCEKICKLLLYGPKELLIKHNMDKHSYNSDAFSMSTLMAEVMKRHLADNLKPLYFCSHCKKFAETPIHTDVKLLNNAIKIPIEYYCRFCRVIFLSSHEMIDYHLLSLEHTTLKCFDELCSEAKINSKKKKLSEESNQNNENNLSEDVQNVLTNNSVKFPNIILTRFLNISQYRGLCKLCGASLNWNSEIIVSHLLECKYTSYNFTKSNKITVKTFDCDVCNHSTNSMNQHSLHIISHSHLSNCYDTNNYYSYFCNECNRYMYSYRFAILKHIKLCHKNMKTIELPIFSIFMANIFKKFNKNANRVEYIHYYSTDKPIKCSKTESIKCRKCKIKFETFSDYNWHLITSEHIILSFVIPKAVKINNKKKKRKMNKDKKEKRKNVNTTNHTKHAVIQTIEPSIIQKVPISQKYDEIKIKSNHTQNAQLNKSPINLDVDERTVLDNNQTVQSLVNNNILEKLNDDVQKGSNKSNENRKLMTPNHIKQWQQYTNYFKHKMSLLKKLRQYENLVMTTLSYYCDVCDFIAVEKYDWEKHNQTEHPVDNNRPITYCSTCFMFVVGGEHNRTIEHSTLLNFLQSLKPVEVLMEKTSLVKLVKSCSSDKNCINLEPKEKIGLNNTDCFKESKYSKDNDSKNSDCFLMKEPNKSREDPMMKNTVLLLDKIESQHEHEKDKTNSSNAAKLIHSEITSSNNLVNTLMTIPHQSNVLEEKMTENINLVNVSTDDLIFNEVENDSELIEIVKSQNKVISNFDETILPPKTNKTQIFEIKKLCELDGDQLYGEYVVQRLKNIQSTTIKQNVKLEIDYIFYTKMKQLSQENTES